MLYKLIGGRHVQDGKEYTRGDTIETSVNLTSMFRGKFTRVIVEKATGVMAEVAAIDPPAIVTKDEVKSKDESDSKPITLGPDMTISFLAAKGTPFKIHKIGEGYQIVNNDGELINPEGLFTRTEVEIYLKNNA